MKYFFIAIFALIQGCASTQPKSTEKEWTQWSHPTKGTFEAAKGKPLASWSEDKLLCKTEVFEKGAVVDDKKTNDPILLKNYMDEYNDHSSKEIMAEILRRRYSYDKKYYYEAVRMRTDIFKCVENKGWQKI